MYCKDETEKIEGEVWKEISNTNGFYFVSNEGRVKSLKGYSAKILKADTNNRGYLRVQLNGKKYFIHRLVAKVFVENDNPKENVEVHHKDGNRKNNKANNL